MVEHKIEDPKISIIIATYNSARFLPEAIDSVLCQTYKQFEIIIINDGSTDNTLQVLEPYLPYITLINQENKGPGVARNSVMHMAKGKYLVFLDADDLLLPDKLKAQLEYLEKYPQVDVVYSNGYYSTLLPDGIIEKQLFTDIGYLRKDLGTPPESIKILAIQNAFPIHAAMVRKAAILDIGGFDKRLPALMDWDLWYRIAQSSNFGYLDLPLVEYRHVPTGLSRNYLRQKTAFSQLCHKIEVSRNFQALPTKIKSDFYFSWGIRDLEFNELQSAKNRFRKALKYNRYNILAFGALGLSAIIGRHTIVFYHWKRKIIGAR
jgi:glycosyltransferase involved in cell wall biosynthesis